jgi:hypothetical protein
VLLRNTSNLPGRHWLILQLVGKTSNRDALGARVRCTVGGAAQVRERVSAGSYGCSHDPRVHFGWGDATAVRELEIRWPGGAVQKLADIKADQILTVQEP